MSSRFYNRLLTLCRLHPKRLAFPESSDPRVLAAAFQLLKEECATEISLFGEANQILALAKQQGISFARYEKQINWSAPSLVEETAAHIAGRLAARGRTLADTELKALATQPLDQAAYLLASDQVDAVIAGCVHTTAEVIRAALRGVGTAPGSKTLSGSFAMVREGEGSSSPHHFVFGDCGVVVNPDVEQLLDIAAASARTFASLFPDQKPHIAFLSFSTLGSADHPHATKMREAAKLFQTRYPEWPADGELQFDAAYDRLVAQRKAPLSKVAGQANCFIFPNLDAGNIAYKMCQRLAGFEAYGPILQGAAKPYTDLSRGASVSDIVVSALIAMRRTKANYS